MTRFGTRTRRASVCLLVALTVCLLPLSTLAASDVGADEAHLVASAAAGGGSGSAEAAEGATQHEIGQELSILWVIPFVGILLSIALGPILNLHWWEHNYPKVSLFWALAFAVPFILVYAMKGQTGTAIYEILHIYIIDYIPFIILLGGLFTAAGGIVLRGSVVGTPMTNIILIAIGTFLASWIGTTGASMVMIRPILRANAHRKHRMHIVIIFIFLVSNIGGALTPLGDPPLFLGFLHGVPFQWTLSLVPEMIFVISFVLLIFYFLEKHFLKREPWEEEEKLEEREVVPIQLAGWHNFIFLLGIMGAVLLSGLWRPGDVNVLGVHVSASSLVRDGIILVMAALAYFTTSSKLREENGFTWEPIREVGYLFAGIFMTIIPALAILRAGEAGAMAFIIRAADSEPAYMWLTGILSSFLDNAPTYLTFFNTALGKLHLTEDVIADYLRMSPLPVFSIPPADMETVAEIIKRHPDAIAGLTPEVLATNLQHFEGYLKAIATGAVFFGAMTYIGNAPNFMVRSIAMENDVKMPSFFGYMAWSIAILIPIFLLVTLVFFVIFG